MKTSLLAAIAAASTLVVLTACQQVPQPATRTDAAGNTITEWPLPAAAGAQAPDLFLAPDGRLLLSWVKPYDRKRHALQFTTYGRDGQWQWAPKTIAVGGSMVVNWADTPHIAATADGTLWANWLQKTRGEGDGEGHSQDIYVSRSSDDGMNWDPPARAHNDGKAVEHGFVSFWPASRDSLGMAWLDGRNTSGDSHAGHDAGHAGGADVARMMTLRSATMDKASRIGNAVEVDDSVCDCCRTDVAITARGPLLVYRNRSVDEIRDIAAVRQQDGTWRAPVTVHDDGWKIGGCPLNGPAVAADGNNAVVAWYTAANDAPKLQLARSSNAGDAFAAPITVDQGEAVQGRTDVALDVKQAWVAWLREDNGGQSLWLARYAPDLSKELSRTEIAKLQGRGRATGFPKLAARDGEAFLVWTDINNGAPQLRGVHVRGP